MIVTKGKFAREKQLISLIREIAKKHTKSRIGHTSTK